ncbi:thiol-disulfide oxidoreductase ResA [Macrococcoides caseolyticum]|uniref:thiol-disulfide oxidoreductase ResA n=1 Tax=Macrococcoides caseolyticum TaxID=69966 RepID=UPI001F2873DC|nr:thiol-disulfide oxidoreductase ResA [Macrococcus caseolyticus]MCE4957093.1 thiol-disulfide oxidoreductase ResA [Macrococcus caseolyticus]
MAKQQKRFVQYIVTFLILLAIIFIVYISLNKDGEKVVKIGDDAPVFELKTLDGDKVNLKDYRKKGLILNFWGTWCKPCLEEMPDLNQAHNAYKNQGVEVLTIHVKDSPQQIKQFFSALDEEVTLPVGLDNGDVMEAYHANDLPNTYIIDKNGKIKAHHKGQMSKEDIKQYMELVKP